MDKEEFKTKLKTLAIELGVIKQEPSNSKFEEVVLADESLVMIEPTVEVGATVMIDVEGEMQPVPDNTYELADGRKIMVVAGKIESIEEVETEETEEEMESKKDTITPEDIEGIMDALGFAQAEAKEAKEAVKTLGAEFKAYKEATKVSTTENFKSVIETIKAIGDQPREKVKEKSSGFKFETPKKKVSAIDKLKEKIK